MRYGKSVLTAFGALVLHAVPAWGHPSSGVHVHGAELLSMLIFGGALAALLRWRSRSLDRR
jgi:hypothetical protein